MACKQEHKNYVSISGKIENRNSDSIVLRNQTASKTIKVNEDGTFKDTLKVNEPSVYAFFDGTASTPVFLKNGFDLDIKVDGENFYETLKFSGEGSKHSNYLNEQRMLQEKLLDPEELGAFSSEELKEHLDSVKKELNTFYNKDESIDSLLLAVSNRNLDPMLNMYQNYFMESIAIREQFPMGSSSPTFKNYENYKGGTTSMEDLKGKYVYIDVWATWCGPCIAEIPAMKELQAKYADKNIHFLSISVDDAFRSGGGDLEVAKNKWKTMIEEKDLGGIQLFSDKNWESDFVKDYKINGIPRFILVDPSGNVVDANAPRPSSKKLVELLDKLEI